MELVTFFSLKSRKIHNGNRGQETGECDSLLTKDGVYKPGTWLSCKFLCFSKFLRVLNTLQYADRPLRCSHPGQQRHRRLCYRRGAARPTFATGSRSRGTVIDTDGREQFVTQSFVTAGPRSAIYLNTEHLNMCQNYQSLPTI